MTRQAFAIAVCCAGWLLMPDGPWWMEISSGLCLTTYALLWSAKP